MKKEGAISQTFFDKVRPSGSQPARLYGFPKIHKPNHPLRPICSSIGSYNYRLASALAKSLSPFTSNVYSIKNTFDFAREIQNLDSKSTHLASFDVSSLFTNIPLRETIDIAIDYAYKNNQTIEGLSKLQFKKLLTIATSETNFIFNEQVYDQIDGVAMGSPLAPILANIFMRSFEEKAINNYEGELPTYYRRYVDDCFLIFRQTAHCDAFFNYMNSLHVNIKFTKDEESSEIDYFPFLDIKIMKGNDCFHTSTYYKATHTGVYTNWHSFTPRKYKINLIKTLLHRALNICSDHDRFHQDAAVIKSNLLKNNFPPALLDAVIKNFTEKKLNNNQEIEKETVTSVPKLQLFLKLPYLGDSSKSFERTITSFVQTAFNQVELKVVFSTTTRISDLFRVKDFIPKRLKSSVVYGIYCTNCSGFYVGKTKRHLKKRFDEHRDVRKLTAVSTHMISTNHDIDFNNVKVLANGNTDTELLIKESLIIKQLKPSLNANVCSFPLEMF